MTIYILAAVGIFVAMGLMRMTYRMSRRDRDEGIRWRGIDWNRGKEEDRDRDEDGG